MSSAGITPSSDELSSHIVNYAMFNTHIGFTIRTEDDGRCWRFPPTQAITKNWKNRSYIHAYTLSEFHDFILGLENNELKIYDVLLNTFREATNMRKTALTVNCITNYKKVWILHLPYHCHLMLLIKRLELQL
jgi:hypothetical protein